VLEYCARFELHPRSGLTMLTRRIKIVVLRNPGVACANAWRGTALQDGSSMGWQQAAPLQAFGTLHPLRVCPTANRQPPTANC
jgi:hypothetical protein